MLTFTYDCNAQNGCLILKADATEQDRIREIVAERGETSEAETEVLESLIANSELDWVSPEDIGALTDAPILGIRDAEGEVTQAWGFMDYCLRSFLRDLVESGQARFQG